MQKLQFTYLGPYRHKMLWPDNSWFRKTNCYNVV